MRIDGETVLVVSDDITLYACNARAGTLKRVFTTTSPLIREGPERPRYGGRYTPRENRYESVKRRVGKRNAF